jgi:hypothetical protein
MRRSRRGSRKIRLSRKRRGSKKNPMAAKAMRLMYSKGVSLKEAWAMVKNKKTKGFGAQIIPGF